MGERACFGRDERRARKRGEKLVVVAVVLYTTKARLPSTPDCTSNDLWNIREAGHQQLSHDHDWL